MKTRLWVCKKCGISWRRYKGDITPPCKYHCGVEVIRARKYPKLQKSKYEKIKDKIEKFNDKYLTKPRNNIGQVLKINKPTKKIFKKLMKCKTKPSFIKYGNIFVNELKNSIQVYETSEDKDSSWCRSIDKNGKISKSRGGFTSVPVVTLNKDMCDYEHGQFIRCLAEGIHTIKLNPKHSINEIQKTFIHEVLHWIDDCNNMRDGYHNCYWNMRLNRFGKMLGFKEELK